MCGFDNTSQKLSNRIFWSQTTNVKKQVGKKERVGGDYNQKASARLVENYCWNFI